MMSIDPIIRKVKIMHCIVNETQSMIHCADIPHGFAKGGLHPTLQELYILVLWSAVHGLSRWCYE